MLPAGSQNAHSIDLQNVHIVHVVRQYLPNVGGLEDVVRNLAVKQLGIVASLKVVTLDRLFNVPGQVLPRQEMIDGVQVVRIPFRGSSRYPIAPSVLREITDADLVHVHGVDFFFDALAITKPWHRSMLVATTHGGFFHTQKYARLKSIWFNTLTRISASRYAAIACCSESDLQLFNRIAPSKTRLIENGVDIEKFWDASSVKPLRRLLTLGRFSSNKRLDRLLAMMRALNADAPLWHLDIAGNESDLALSDLKRSIEELGLSGQVTVHLRPSIEELRDLMARCSLFVSASEYEGFGLALIEAMSAGLVPVVNANEAFQSLARKHPEIKIVDFAVDGASHGAISTAFKAIEENPDLRGKVMNAARIYGWDPKAQQYADLYRKALDC